MKLALLLLSYMLQDAGYTVANLDQGKCSACVRAGVKSKVWPGTCSSTLLHCPEFYDEDGKLVQPQCNSVLCSYVCSNGHHIPGVVQ